MLQGLTDSVCLFELCPLTFSVDFECYSCTARIPTAVPTERTLVMRWPASLSAAADGGAGGRRTPSVLVERVPEGGGHPTHTKHKQREEADATPRVQAEQSFSNT